MKNILMLILLTIAFIFPNSLYSQQDGFVIVVATGCSCLCTTSGGSSSNELQFEPNAATCNDGVACVTSKGISGISKGCETKKRPVKAYEKVYKKPEFDQPENANDKRSGGSNKKTRKIEKGN